MPKPWITLGISESTYWRRKRDSKPDSDSNLTVDDSTPVTVPKKIVFDGTNGNVCGNITRKEMKVVLDAGGKFIPNWYSAGCLSKLGVLTGKG